MTYAIINAIIITVAKNFKNLENDQEYLMKISNG